MPITSKVMGPIYITLKLTQVGNPATIVTKCVTGSEAGSTRFEFDEGVIIVTSDSVLMMRTGIAGCAVKPGVLSLSMDSLDNPIIIPSQTLNRVHFAAAPRPNGVSTSGIPECHLVCRIWKRM